MKKTLLMIVACIMLAACGTQENASKNARAFLTHMYGPEAANKMTIRCEQGDQSYRRCSIINVCPDLPLLVLMCHSGAGGFSPANCTIYGLMLPTPAELEQGK